ncbi:MAG: MerR family DNA-binding transcriptional regulator, partial [Chloroflexota bacterium]
MKNIHAFIVIHPSKSLDINVTLWFIMPVSLRGDVPFEKLRAGFRRSNLLTGWDCFASFAMTRGKMYTVKQLSKLAGVTPRTLHYYDE